jgi:hypothetical protein
MRIDVRVYVYVHMCVSRGKFAPYCFVLIIAFMRSPRNARPPGHFPEAFSAAVSLPVAPPAQLLYYGGGVLRSFPGTPYGEPHKDTHNELSDGSSPLDTVPTALLLRSPRLVSAFPQSIILPYRGRLVIDE